VRQTLDSAAAEAVVLQGAQQVIREGADVTMRTAGRHDQAVGHRTLVLEVDAHDVLGLVFVQAVQDEIFQSGDATLVVGRGFGRAKLLRRARRV
jgi:hypothetical protein